MCIYRSAETPYTSGDPHPVNSVLTYRTAAHVVPEGLGQNDDIFAEGMLCDRCNRYFGQTLEPALLRHPTLASDMQRLGVLGKGRAPRTIIGNWRRSEDGSYWVPMAPPKPSGTVNGRPFLTFLPILDCSFDQLKFRRGLHLLAFNTLVFRHTSGQAYDPRHPKYDAVRSYIRAPKRPKEAWPFLQRYDPPAAGGNVEVGLCDADSGVIVKIRAYSFEFYVDLLNSGTLLAWAQTKGIGDHINLIEPGVRYPASPTMEEIPEEERWWIRLSDGMIQVGTSGSAFTITPVGPRQIVRG
jgi:hypothetical protein